jgi:hypothetical protein
MNFDTETKLPGGSCPFCGRENDRCSGDGNPEPGSVTVCIGCGQVAVFDENLNQVCPTEEMRQELEADPRIQQIRVALKQVKSQFN